VDTIPPCEQVALLPVWVHIRFCDCGVDDDDDDATATKDSAVKIKTTIIIAVRALIIAMLFIHISNNMSV
jgi:hypothetical protein